MILVVGSFNDACCKDVVDILSARAVPHHWISEQHLLLGGRTALAIAEREGPVTSPLCLLDVDAAFGKVSAILARISNMPSSEGLDENDGAYAQYECVAFLFGLLHAFDGTVINRLRPESRNCYKLSIPSLRTLLAGTGLQFPRFVMTNSVREIIEFLEGGKTGIVYTPFTAPSEYAIRTEGEIEPIRGLARQTPLMFREDVQGSVVRVLVVSPLLTEADAEIPSSLLNTCGVAAERLGLVFCQFTFIVTSKGDHICLGVDPMPEVASLPPELRGHVATALAKRLSDGSQ